MRLIDADDLRDIFLSETCLFTPDDVLDYIDSTCTEDAVPVVRCKDCAYAERYERLDGESGYYCGHPQSNFTYGERWDRIYKPVKEANDFCSYGERKDGVDICSK